MMETTTGSIGGAIPAQQGRADGDGAARAAIDRKLRWARWGTLGASLALYAVACVTPALQFGTDPPRPKGGAEIWPGFAVAASGMLGVIGLQFAWFANPVLLVAQIGLALRWWWVAFFAGLLAVALAANVAFLPFQRYPYSEGPNFFHFFVERPLIGCFLWLASVLIVPLGAGAGIALTDRRRRL